MPNQYEPDANGFKISVSERMTRLEEQVREIRENHLLHLSADIQEIRKDISDLRLIQARWIGGGAVLIFLSQLLFAFILSRHS